MSAPWKILPIAHQIHSQLFKRRNSRLSCGPLNSSPTAQTPQCRKASCSLSLATMFVPVPRPWLKLLTVLALISPPCLLKYHHPVCIPAPSLSTPLFPSLSTSQVLPFICFFSAHIKPPSVEGAFTASPLRTIPLLPSLLTCPVGQRAPEGLGVHGTVLQTTGQALDQDIVTVEGI